MLHGRGVHLDDERLDRLYRTVAGPLGRVARRLAADLGGETPETDRLTRHVCHLRGKMLRPALVLLSGQASGHCGTRHETLAAVVELIHRATLVHDDVLDEADVRRRGPALNRLLGNEGAVLLGDYLISHAFVLAAELGDSSVLHAIGRTIRCMCEGELTQIQRRGDFKISEQEYLAVIDRKTASLLAACCELGARLSDADPDTCRRLEAFGRQLGMAFQIIDDVLDLTGTTEHLGKSVGRDLDKGELTLPVIRLLATDDRQRRKEVWAVLSDGAVDRSARIRALLDGTDALDYSCGMARQYVSHATDMLTPLPDSPARRALASVGEFILSGTK